MSRIVFVSALFITLNLSGCGAEDDQNAEVEASVCGDGMVTGNEGCDGQDMAGLTCGDFPRFGEYGGGALTCSSTCELVLGCLPIMLHISVWRLWWESARRRR